MRSKKGKKGWMAIKVDLEKAYDRLDCDFLKDTLENIGIKDKLLQLIINCTTTSQSNVLWNGEKTQYFKPSKCICQGDPLSPYLFVLCMERLGHVINKSVRQGD